MLRPSANSLIDLVLLTGAGKLWCQQLTAAANARVFILLLLLLVDLLRLFWHIIKCDLIVARWIFNVKRYSTWTIVSLHTVIQRTHFGTQTRTEDHCKSCTSTLLPHEFGLLNYICFLIYARRVFFFFFFSFSFSTEYYGWLATFIVWSYLEWLICRKYAAKNKQLY